jgi:hypothetical protein
MFGNVRACHPSSCHRSTGLWTRSRTNRGLFPDDLQRVHTESGRPYSLRRGCWTSSIRRAEAEPGSEDRRSSFAGNIVTPDRRPDPVPRTTRVRQRSKGPRFRRLRSGPLDHEHCTRRSADRSQPGRCASPCVLRTPRHWVCPICRGILHSAKAMRHIDCLCASRACAGSQDCAVRIIGVLCPNMRTSTTLRTGDTRLCDDGLKLNYRWVSQS